MKKSLIIGSLILCGVVSAEVIADYTTSRGRIFTPRTVRPVQPALDIEVSPQPQEASNIFAGSNYQINVSAFGGGELSYQWQKNGVDISGANESLIDFQPTTVNDSGQYSVSVRNETGGLMSFVMHLTVEVDRFASLSWTPPVTRINGTPITLDEISGYKIYHTNPDRVESTYDISVGATTYVLQDLPDGTHRFSITAIDTNDQESLPSNTVSKDI